MAIIIQNNETFSIGDVTHTYDKLPVGNYSLQYDDMKGFYLKKQEDFLLPKKLYGKFDYVDRWVKSAHNKASKNLGILLSGEKGTGKTIAAQLFCDRMNLPVIFITTPHSGPGFENFISHPLFRGTIIFIDEFEKVFSDYDDSEALLTLMDGIYNTDLIFVLTVNDFYINKRLNNRLNRIKYHKIFEDMTVEESTEIIDDLLEHSEFRDSLIDFCGKTPLLSIDILMQIIKEVNLFKEDPFECATHLNLINEPINYNITIRYKDIWYECYPKNLTIGASIFTIDFMEAIPQELSEYQYKTVDTNNTENMKRVGKDYYINLDGEVLVHLTPQKFTLAF